MIALAVSAAVAALLAPGAIRAFGEAGWTRPNYRGVEVAFPIGVVAVIAALPALAVDALAGSGEGEFLVLFGALDRYEGAPFAGPASAIGWSPLFLGVAFLGLLDDLLEGAPRGWRGHFGAVVRGGFSTGVLKAVGTLCLAIFVVGNRFDDDAAEAVLAVALIVVATNVFNLLDLRPGRAWKAYVLLLAGLLIADGTGALDAIGPFAGALLVLGLFDLRERGMLGDTGSNLLGALAGVHLVLVLGTTGQLIALGLLVALTIFGEFRSISATIERLPPLRSLDSLGRRDA